MEFFEFSLFDGNCTVCALVMANGSFMFERVDFSGFEYEFLWINLSENWKQYKAKEAYKAILAEAEAETEDNDPYWFQREADNAWYAKFGC